MEKTTKVINIYTQTRCMFEESNTWKTKQENVKQYEIKDKCEEEEK